MNELAEILDAFDALCAEGKPAALATVIATEGSAYRRPGARMLVAEDGRTWGGVSGGCLERDVARRGRGVIATGQSVRCRYETGDDEAIAAGTATGCGGTIELFIQPVSAGMPGPLPAFDRVVRQRRGVVLSSNVGTGISAGCCEILAEEGSAVTSRAASSASVTDEAGLGGAISGQRPESVGSRELGSATPGDTLPTELDLRTGESRLLKRGSAEYFVERLAPPQSLIVFGGGPDAVPVVAFAKLLGWHVTVVASRPATGAVERFASADELHITGPDDPVAGVVPSPDSAVVVMTHNLARDTAILAGLRGPFRYFGLLGPRHRTRRVFDDLPNRSVRGVLNADVHNPIGLDLGSRTPEEIAMAIVAEIQSVVRAVSGRPLCERRPHVRHPLRRALETKLNPDAMPDRPTLRLF